MSDLNVSLEVSSDEDDSSLTNTTDTATEETKPRLQRAAETIVKLEGDHTTPAIAGVLHGRYGVDDTELSDIIAAINQAKHNQDPP